LALLWALTRDLSTAAPLFYFFFSISTLASACFQMQI
jgi:hypothetical protein